MSLLRTATLSSFALLLTACGGSGTSTNTDNTVYRITFADQWDAARFPTEFPSNRHFSGLIGATHNEQVIFWESGQLATPGIKDMAETGAKDDLKAEVDDAIDEGKANQVLNGDGIGGSPSSVSMDFIINKDYPLVTLVSMVAPSPDWFVGVNSLDLRGEDGEFVQQLTVALKVYDAGTDNGTRFTSSNSTSTGEVITRLSCESTDCDFLTGVHRDPVASTSNIGSFHFERIQ